MRPPLGARPFAREQYVAKFRALADGVVADDVQDTFLDAVRRLPELSAEEVGALALPGVAQLGETPATKGLF